MGSTSMGSRRALSRRCALSGATRIRHDLAQLLQEQAHGALAVREVYEGRRGQLTVKSMAIGESRRASVSTRSTLVFEVREELRWAVVVASRLPSSERCFATQRAGCRGYLSPLCLGALLAGSIAQNPALVALFI